MADPQTIERWIGAVLVPEVRVAGTFASAPEVVPSRDYLARFPPAMVVAFGRTPSGARSPSELLERVRAMCAELGAPRPIAACDLEQGAGLHFDDATRLPPALALASAALADGGDEGLDWIAAAGELTASEARARGVELVLAPVADVNTARDNPIIAVRAFGDDPERAAARATAFAIGLHAGGALGCAKHFPGHGDTSRDSHLELPRVERDAAGLRAIELAPFRRLVQHEIDTAMIAHLDVPALTGRTGLPCTLSSAAIEGCLRGELGFMGPALSDAMNMGALASFEPRYVRALEAGCDGLLCPHDPGEAAKELLDALRDGRLSVDRLRTAALRMHALRERAAAVRVPAQADARANAGLAQRLARRALRASRAWSGAVGAVEAARPASETPEIAAGIELLRREVVESAGELVLLPVVCEARAGRGRYGLTEAEGKELRDRVATLAPSRRVLIVWFGSPQSVPPDLWSAPELAVLLAFAPTPPMFAAVARTVASLARGRAAALPASGSLPARIG